MSYNRDTYTLLRYEFVAPHVRNDGQPSGYRDAMREALIIAGYTNWSEFESIGAWNGKLEPGTTFVLYLTPRDSRYLQHEDVLSKLARSAMPDQDAIQIVRYPQPVTLIEA